ncbi:Zn-dependent exopeptidase M28 [Kribbella capetownensis]|uniref:Zn-dependent exopeptidase M28 n=1 Tax=Kribbella capetownensis TaxID=1572659 RepID=A0A4V2M7J2_9ACTN|nr:M28 family peptidase [Kribbella capetownensis]TCC47832.1 Zn-dependent exopeptidase M28 [Kribbella capetownensis]
MRAALAAFIVLLAVACTSSTPPRLPSPAPPTSAPQPRSTPTSTSSAAPPSAPVLFDSRAALQTVGHLAGLGPREATSPAYLRALTWLEQRFRAAGYQTTRQPVRVPSGVSWGVAVRAGTSWNLLAAEPGLTPSAPHRVVGAHLDTVPQAPGAEDNASGVSVLLGTAQLYQRRAPKLPTVFVAFGAEEPRGDGDNRHHYGSRTYVASLPPAQRRALRGMVSLDRVGVGTVVPICSAQADAVAMRNELRAAAARTRVPSRPCVNRSSDHWSFVRSGLPGVRLGSTPYAEYHSARDLPRVVSPDQLGRMGRVVTAWLDS